METLTITPTNQTPEVVLNAQDNIFLLAGRSAPENVAPLYFSIFDWMEKYTENPNTQTIFEFKMIYYNTASAKMLLSVMHKLEILKEKGNEVLIRWYYPEEDDDMMECGEDFAQLVQVPFQFIKYSLDD